MLKIFINEKAIDLGKKFAGIPLILKSEFLTNKSAFSFPFIIPNNLTNREAINLLEYKQNYEVPNTADIKITFNSFSIAGNVNITDINDSDIELNFLAYESSIFDKYNSVKLTDIDNSTQYLPDEGLFNSGLVKNDIYTIFPVDMSTQTNLTWQFVNPLDRWFFNYYGTEQNELSKFYILENSGSVFPGTPIVNYNNRLESSVSPFYFLPYVISVVYDYLGINIEENILETDPDYADMVVFYPTQKLMSDGADKVSFEFHLPPLKIIDFIDELEKRLGIRFVLNPFKRSVKIISFSDIIKAQTNIDITNKVSNLRFGILKTENFILRQDVPDDKFLDSTYFPDKIVSTSLVDKTQEITVKSISGINSVLIENILSDEEIAGVFYWDYHDFECIRIGYDIDNLGEAKAWEDHQFRLMFWNVKLETDRYQYNSLGVGRTNLTKENIPVGTYSKGNRSLKWEDSGKGIYDTEYSNIIFWKNNFAKPVTINARFLSSDLTDFDFLKKYYVDNIEVLIEEIPVTLYANSIEIGDIKAVTT